MKNASPFSPEALGLTGPVEIEQPASPPIIQDTFCRVNKQFKLRKLLEFLQSAAEKDPEILDLPVFTVEFGALERVAVVSIEREAERIIIAA
jgi:hypothetical protein